MLEWRNASNYCEQHCGSELVSIHSLEEHSNIITFVNQQSNYVSADIWIGLQRNLTDGTFYWIDNSPFDYGTDLSGSIEPWKRDKPLPLEQQRECVLLNKDQDKMLWNDFKCNNRKHFLCNDCDGILNKYVIPRYTYDYANAESGCEELYNTSLASIHNANDMDDAKFICSQSTRNDTNGCWIGSDTYMTSSANYLDALNEYSMASSTANSNTMAMYNIICNAPSQLCRKQEWEIIQGIHWNYAIKPCEIVHNYDVNIDDNEIKLYSKQWLVKHDIALVIQYIYTMTDIDFSLCNYCGEAGIELYTDTHLYYIGISYSGNSVFLVDLTLFDILAYQVLDFEYNLGIFYSLTVELLNDTMTIFVNNKEYILYNMDIDIDHTMIGIKHSKSSIISKSLFVSDTPQFVNNHTAQYQPVPSACIKGSMICRDGSLIATDSENACHFFECPAIPIGTESETDDFTIIITVNDLNESDVNEITNIAIHTLLAEHTNINILSTEVIDNSIVILFTVPSDTDLDKDIIGKHIKQSLEQKYNKDFDVSVKGENDGNTKGHITDEMVIIIVISMIILFVICFILIYCIVMRKSRDTIKNTQSREEGVTGETVVRMKSISSEVHASNIEMQQTNGITNGNMKQNLMSVGTPQSDGNITTNNYNGNMNQNSDHDDETDDAMYEQNNVTNDGLENNNDSEEDIYNQPDCIILPQNKTMGNETKTLTDMAISLNDKEQSNDEIYEKNETVKTNSDI